MKQPIPLEPAVRAWLERYTGPGGRRRTRSFLEEGSLLVGDAEYGRLLGQVLDAIKGRSPITDQDDLEAVLFLEAGSALIEALAAGGDMNRAVSRVSERLLMPEKEYNFCAPLSLRGKLPVEVTVGGPHGLKITNKPGPTKEGDDPGVELSGRVSAVI